MLRLIFWASLAAIVYTYLGYPLILFVLSACKKKAVSKSEFYPSVSIVVAAYNESRNIGRRLENLIAQDYPGKVDIIVVSDGSEDGTDQIVREYKEQQGNIELLSLPARQGKAVAVNYGVSVAKGEIIVFADARQTFRPNAIRQLVSNFTDQLVGCVSGEMVFIATHESMVQAEMDAYWLYEKWIRKMECRTGSTMGATGAIYAIRRKLYKPIPFGTLLDDVLTPMNIVMQGYRVIFDSDAVCYDVPSKDVSHEWRRKVRTLAGNWQLLSISPRLLSPVKNPCWWRFFSHKLMRLAVPFLLPVILVSGSLLFTPVYRIGTAIQALLYSLVVMGFAMPGLRKFRVINMPYFFILLNLAVLAGFWRWISGQCKTVWVMQSKVVDENKIT